MSAILFIVGGIAIGLGLWSGVVQVGLYYVPVYYLCAFVSVSLAISLRRYGL